jgi:pimeloyl-ACP methyl ester carboxylesterase
VGILTRVIGRKAPGFLRWRSWGAAERRALLLHDSTSSSATWWRVGPALAEAGWRVKAPDLPSHGASPRADKSLTPEVAAEWVAAELADRPIDLVVGHCFGAAVALALLDRGPAIDHLVLEEPPGLHSVDWEAKAESVVAGVAATRRDPRAAYAQLRRDQPRWDDEDCQRAVADLASACANEIAGGLRKAADWPQLEQIKIDRPIMVIAAPDAPGVSRGEDATALRGSDRSRARMVADEFVELDGGHCLHRDLPDDWLRIVTGFAG